VSIARPVAQIFVHGKVEGGSNFCANPVIVNRNDPNHAWWATAPRSFSDLWEGEFGFRVVQIERNGFPFLTIANPDMLGSDDAEIMTGRAFWKAARWTSPLGTRSG